MNHRLSFPRSIQSPDGIASRASSLDSPVISQNFSWLPCCPLISQHLWKQGPFSDKQKQPNTLTQHTFLSLLILLYFLFPTFCRLKLRNSQFENERLVSIKHSGEMHTAIFLFDFIVESSHIPRSFYMLNVLFTRNSWVKSRTSEYTKQLPQTRTQMTRM